AVNMLAHLHHDALSWTQVRYLSPNPSGKLGKRKQLWHYCGSLNLGHSTVPVVGFPFLRTPKTHNSHAELVQLGNCARECLQDQGCVPASSSISARRAWM